MIYYHKFSLENITCFFNTPKCIPPSASLPNLFPFAICKALATQNAWQICGGPRAMATATIIATTATGGYQHSFVARSNRTKTERQRNGKRGKNYAKIMAHSAL